MKPGWVKMGGIKEREEGVGFFSCGLPYAPPPPSPTPAQDKVVPGSLGGRVIPLAWGEGVTHPLLGRMGAPSSRGQWPSGLAPPPPHCDLGPHSFPLPVVVCVCLCVLCVCQGGAVSQRD